MEDGYSSLHFVIAAVFAVTVALGSFAGTMAMTSMSEGEMSDVSGQAGIEMDLDLGSFAINTVNYIDNDGYTGGATPTTGVAQISNINPSGNLKFTGITIDAEGSTSVGGNSTSAIVVGLPSVPSGLSFDVSVATSAAEENFSKAPDGASIGKFEVGGIDMSSATIKVTGN